MNIIVDAFEYQIFESKHRPKIDVHNDLRDDCKSLENFWLPEP